MYSSFAHVPPPTLLPSNLQCRLILNPEFFKKTTFSNKGEFHTGWKIESKTKQKNLPQKLKGRLVPGPGHIYFKIEVPSLPKFS